MLQKDLLKQDMFLIGCVLSSEVVLAKRDSMAFLLFLFVVVHVP